MRSTQLSSEGSSRSERSRGKRSCADSRSLAWENGKVLRNLGMALLIVLGSAASQAAAQSWAEKMFKTLDHDFGTVARGADTVYKFEVNNIYKEDMTLNSVRSSCGCTSPSLEGPNGPVPEGASVTLKSHEKAYIVARFNTRTHVGQKGATLTVTLGGRYAGEVQLHVHGLIRGDVVFSPGAVEFGEVNEGQSAEQKVTVAYAGRPDWEIVDITNDNDNFEVELNETERGNGRVSYDLVVRLKGNVPAGYIKDQLTVVTNDNRSQNQRIPLFVAGHVRPEFSVTPSQLVLGELKPGQVVTRKIIVRGREPFKILDVNCGDNCFVFKKDDESKAVHFVEVTFTAGERPGKLQTPIHIVTDRNNREATCLASATVTAGEPATGVVEPTQSAAAKTDDNVVQTVAAQ